MTRKPGPAGLEVRTIAPSELTSIERAAFGLPVDVLAVMDDAAVTLQKTAQIQFMERAEEMREARAAVAELIEKSEAALHYMRLHKYADQAWADDLEAALARVGGAA